MEIKSLLIKDTTKEERERIVKEINAEYLHIHGFDYKRNVIAYQIRQSFKPGEVTPEEANRIGYETAMRWTQGKHRKRAFEVATEKGDIF